MNQMGVISQQIDTKTALESIGLSLSDVVL
jgi:hypothetical protein